MRERFKCARAAGDRVWEDRTDPTIKRYKKPRVHKNKAMGNLRAFFVIELHHNASELACKKAVTVVSWRPQMLVWSWKRSSLKIWSICQDRDLRVQPCLALRDAMSHSFRKLLLEKRHMEVSLPEQSAYLAINCSCCYHAAHWSAVYKMYSVHNMLIFCMRA